MEAAFERGRTSIPCESPVETDADAWQMLAHDLRVPLVGVQKVLELALKDRSNEESVNRNAEFTMLQSAQANVEIMLDMLTDILDLKHLRTGEFFVVRTPINIKCTIERCIDILRFSAAEKSVTFIIRPQDEIPNVLADERRLVRILVNLLHNALKYSPTGERIDISCQVNSDKHVTISVTDLGPGIAPRESLRILAKGYRGDSNIPNAEKGYGWGLYYCKLAVTSLGGRIWIEDPGPAKTFGARVCFTVPTVE